MTRWELLEEAKKVLWGKYGNGSLRRTILGVNYKAIQNVVDCVLKNEDHISKEIEKKKVEIAELEAQKEKEDKKKRDSEDD